MLEVLLFTNSRRSVIPDESFARTKDAPPIKPPIPFSLQSSPGCRSRRPRQRYSFGAAIAILDAFMLRQHLNLSDSINTIIFAPPRGGDRAFAPLIAS
jgi:hypothetical protein